MEKAEPFGFKRGTITVQAPPIELNPEIIMPDINIPDIKPEVTVNIEAPVFKIDAPVVHCDPTIKVEPIIRADPPHVTVEPEIKVTVQMPESRGWKFFIHKRKDGDIEMTARPL
jgi:hypothetical protein